MAPSANGEHLCSVAHRASPSAAQAGAAFGSTCTDPSPGADASAPPVPVPVPAAPPTPAPLAPPPAVPAPPPPASGDADEPDEQPSAAVATRGINTRSHRV